MSGLSYKITKPNLVSTDLISKLQNASFKFNQTNHLVSKPSKIITTCLENVIATALQPYKRSISSLDGLRQRSRRHMWMHLKSSTFYSNNLEASRFDMIQSHNENVKQNQHKSTQGENGARRHCCYLQRSTSEDLLPLSISGSYINQHPLRRNCSQDDVEQNLRGAKFCPHKMCTKMLDWSTKHYPLERQRSAD